MDSAVILRVLVDLYAVIKHQGAEVPILVYTQLCDPISQLEDQILLFFETLTALGSEDATIARAMRDSGLLS